MSQLLIQTLRQTPTEATLPGHQFLLRGGFVRTLAPGSYSFLPLGAQVRGKIATMARRALRAIGGQEVALPQIQPADLWVTPESWGELTGDSFPFRREAIHFRDRSQRHLLLGTGHEEAVLTLARSVIQSYRQLPVLLFQIWQPFHDQAQTGGGLFGARETLVVDGYSLHTDETDLSTFAPHVRQALADVCQQCGVNPRQAIAEVEPSGAAIAHKLVWPFEMGEERLVRCHACGHTADQIVARVGKMPPPPEEMRPMEEVETPNCKTIADLARFLNISESRTAKALFLVAHIEGQGDRFVFAVVRGDTDLNEAKLKRVLKAETIGPATEAEIRNIGAEPGYGSPVGLEGVTVVVDDLIPQSPNLVAGANRPGYHTLNVNYGRDYRASLVADITLARDGDPCPECGKPLRLERGVEIAATANLGHGYSRTLEVTCLDQKGQAQPLVMGRYRLYADRLLAAVAETHHDQQGLLWPASIAPCAVYLMTLGKRSQPVTETADALYAELSQAGIDVLYDDRDERAGVKFNDADLLGCPLRVVVGERGLEGGTVELKRRREKKIETVPIGELRARVQEALAKDYRSSTF